MKNPTIISTLKVIVALALVLFLTNCNGDKTKEKLIIWQTESDPNARQVLREIEEEFENQHDVEIEIILNSWGAQADKLTNAIKTNSLPDIAHIQPFMAMSFVSIDKLVPLDDIYKKLEKKHGELYDIAKEVAKHNGTNYGIPYALGTTSWSYNTSKCIDGFDLALTWDDFIANSLKSKELYSDFSIMVPGASSFFMEQLYAELLANNNGKMFDEEGTPLFSSQENLEVLGFLRKLKDNNLLHPNWKNQTYLDQFTQLAQEKTSCVLVTYARASNTIKEILKRESKDSYASDSLFAWMHQPVGHSKLKSIASVDCEPWVIFKNENFSPIRENLCKEFLLTFYDRKNYIKFTSQVPIHLTPIFIDFAKDSSYNQAIQGWESWNVQTMDYLLKKDNLDTRPILMPDNTERGKSWGFLLELQYTKILSDAILRTLSTDEDIRIIANDMQAESEHFLLNMQSK